ncbi:MAG TPA: hypothetical protein PKA82_11835 [Pyrinomonadaceae bacterium]|nr:hypothetical protein [Pyrinomonadaceae bacterium]
MRSKLFKAVFLCALVLVLADVGLSQSGPQVGEKDSGNSKSTTSSLKSNGNPVLKLAGQVTVIVIKSAAKTAWATTKFAAKDLAKPILFKLTPIVAKHSLKLTGVAAKHLLPIAIKLAVL